MQLGTGLIPTLNKGMFLLLLFHCGYQDVKYRRVKNSSAVLLGSVAVVLLGWVLQVGRIQWLDLALAISLAAASYFLYCAGVFGAGDVKVLSLGGFIGYLLWGWSFSTTFVLLWLLDGFWALRYSRQVEQVGAPLIWLWAWSCGLFAVFSYLLVRG